MPFAWKDAPLERRRSRRRLPGCELLEERCVLSSVAVKHPLRAEHTAKSEEVAIKAAAAAPLVVWWAYPTPGTQVGGGPGFLAVGFNQAVNAATATNQTVQLAYQNSSGAWVQVPINIAVNPGTNSVVVTPLADQPNGLYTLAVYPGIQSAGGTLASPYFDQFVVHDTWGQPGGQDPVTVFPSSNGSSGVVVADQSRALDPSTVNANTIKLYHVNANGSTGAALTAGVDYTITYDPEIPSIELALTSGLTAGTYRYVEQGVHDQAGNVQTQAVALNFTLTQNLDFPYPPGPSPIYVASAYPAANAISNVTPIDEIVFDRPANPATVNTSTVQLAVWLPSQDKFSNALPITVSYNPVSQSAEIIPSAGLAEGNYLLMVSQGTQKVIGTDGVPMASPFYLHYTFYNPTAPPVDGRVFAPYPANGSTVSGDPLALMVFLQKFAGDEASSINTTTVQLHPLIAGGPGNALPITVAYNPWPGVIVINPLEALGDGAYEITVNGVVDIAGNVQRTAFSSWFVVTNTGRPQTLS